MLLYYSADPKSTLMHATREAPRIEASDTRLNYFRLDPPVVVFTAYAVGAVYQIPLKV